MFIRRLLIRRLFIRRVLVHQPLICQPRGNGGLKEKWREAKNPINIGKDISESRTLHDPPLPIEYSRPATAVKPFRRRSMLEGFLPAGEALAKGQVASPAGRFFGVGLPEQGERGLVGGKRLLSHARGHRSQGA